MRLFIGLWPDDAAANELSAWAHDLHVRCGGRMMRPEDLHLTLAFLGHTTPDQAGTLIDAVTEWSVPIQAFSLDCVGRFERARVVWAGCSDARSVTWLYTLYDTLWDRLVDMGWCRPDSTFVPHVSLLRSAGPCDLSRWHGRSILVRPQRCVLVASRPGEARSNYQVLASLPVL